MTVAPKSLAGQLTLLLLALALALGVAVALFAWERIDALRDAHRGDAVQRTATVARLLAETPPALHESVIAAASTEFTRFSLTGEPVVEKTAGSERAAAIANDLSAALGIPNEAVRVAPLWTRHLDDDPDDDRDDDRDHGEDDDRDRDRGHDHDGRDHQEPDWFTASAGLAEGRWLNVAVGPPLGAPAWGAAFVAIFLLSALGIAAVAVVTGRRLAKPMQGLANAAGRLGRGEAVQDLPEAGPVETRETVRAFNLMRTRLDRYVRDRSAMLAAVSHDLRTPITSLRLHAELVEDAKTRTKILVALEEMQRMTEDALAFIRQDIRREETRSVDLHALLDSVAADLGELGHDIAVAETERIVVACRPAVLRRALRNLLENAAAYGGRTAAHIERTGEEICIVVEDEGPGIPEAELERVFEPFVRLDSSRSRDTASSRARWAGRSSSRSVSSRIASRGIFTSWPVTDSIVSARRTKPSASPHQRLCLTSGSLSCDLPARVSLLTPAMREALPNDGMPSSPALATIALRRFDQKDCRSSGIPSMRVNSRLGPYGCILTPSPCCSSQAMLARNSAPAAFFQL